MVIVRRKNALRMASSAGNALADSPGSNPSTELIDLADGLDDFLRACIRARIDPGCSA